MQTRTELATRKHTAAPHGENERIALSARALEERALEILGADLHAHRAAEIARDHRPPDRTRGPLAESARRLVRLHPARWPEARALLHRADGLLWQVVARLDCMIAAVCRQLSGYTMNTDPDDAIQIARLAVFDSLLRWMPSQGSLRQCAKAWIRSRLQRAPDTQGDVRGAKDDRHGIRRIVALRLDAPVTLEGDSARYVDLLPGDALDASELVAQLDQAGDLRRVREAVGRLPTRTAQILMERIGGTSLEAAGAPWGISRERTRQVYQDGLRAVRAHVAAVG